MERSGASSHLEATGLERVDEEGHFEAIMNILSGTALSGCRGVHLEDLSRLGDSWLSSHREIIPHSTVEP